VKLTMRLMSSWARVCLTVGSWRRGGGQAGRMGVVIDGGEAKLVRCYDTPPLSCISCTVYIYIHICYVELDFGLFYY
jgi:hypothetical protein